MKEEPDPGGVGWGGRKNKAHTADCLQQLSEVLWTAMTQTNCASRSRDGGEFPLRAVTVVYERATSLAAGDPIRQGSSFLGSDKTLQGLSQLYATHRDLVAGVREMAFKVTLRKDSVIQISSFGLAENKAFCFVFCQIRLLLTCSDTYSAVRKPTHPPRWGADTENHT